MIQDENERIERLEVFLAGLEQGRDRANAVEVTPEGRVDGDFLCGDLLWLFDATRSLFDEKKALEDWYEWEAFSTMVPMHLCCIPFETPIGLCPDFALGYVFGATEVLQVRCLRETTNSRQLYRPSSIAFARARLEQLYGTTIQLHEGSPT
jgi:hypothetical protein